MPQKITRPALRCYGGKWISAQWIISQFPTHKIYVEPFGGGASVLLKKPRSFGEVYNDLDGAIVNFFRVLQNPSQAKELERLLQLTPFARTEYELACNSLGEEPVEQARRLLVRASMGFGGWQGMNNAFGFRAQTWNRGLPEPSVWVNYPKNIAIFSQRLMGVVIENRDAAAVIKQHDGPTTLFYCDPPYPKEARRPNAFGKGYTHEMSDKAHRDLAELLHGVVGAVVISGYDCSLYEELYADWVVERHAVRTSNGPRTECLWLNGF